MASALIEVDGGINSHTGGLCKQAGANVLVAGSYVFKDDIIAAVDSLW
jgi:ribulose-phosphate 3-epimerase